MHKIWIIIPLKKGVMILTWSLVLSVCHHVCGEMAGLSNMVSSEVNTIYQELENATLVKMIRSVSVSYNLSAQNITSSAPVAN